MATKKMYKCECHGEAVCVEIDAEDKNIVLSYWHEGFGPSVLTWAARLKLAWNVLKTGSAYTDMVLLDFPTANEMGKDIIAATEPKRWLRGNNDSTGK